MFGEKKKGKIWTNSRSWQVADGKLSAQGLSPIKTTAMEKKVSDGGGWWVEIGTMKLIYQTVKNWRGLINQLDGSLIYLGHRVCGRLVNR